MGRAHVATIVVVAMAGVGVSVAVERTVPASPGSPDAVTGFVETWGFETDEGFAPGFVGGQAGWVAYANSTVEPHIDTAHPRSGAQHLRISWDPTPGVGWPGVKSPYVPDLVPDASTMSVWVAIGAVGGAEYEVITTCGLDQTISAWVVFESDGDISVLDNPNWVWVDTGYNWNPGAYVKLAIDIDPLGDSISYWYGGTRIWTCGVFDGSLIEQVHFNSNNSQNGEHADFDDLVVDRGELVPVRHRWSFTSDGSDPVGGAHASLFNGASVTGGALVFDGVNDFASLPIADTLDDLTDVSVEMWATWRGWESWERFFDFGTGTTVNWFMTPSAGDTGTPRVAITTGGNPGEQRTDSGVPFPRHELTHVVFTLDGDGAAEQAKLYMNGDLVGSSHFSSPLDPAELGPLTDLWLGRSQYDVDPYLDGSIDELVIYDGVLSQAEVVEHYRAFVFADGFEWGGTDRWSAASP
ncbi:MAG TPA: LamG domain-containing protein [Candidatus Sulfomarinibacteraceae bacterium]|nr:LamG domain-containing protein [Candidatus Sulfomarinibacteraceae bacterium]